MASLVTRSVMGAWPATSAARAWTRASMASGATISWTKPAASASCGAEEPGREEEGRDARGSEEIHQARIGVGGQAVAERSRDGRAEARVRGRDPEVARGGDPEAGADGEALDLGDDGLPDRLQATDTAVAVPLVGDAVRRPLERRELADVGPRHERLAAGAPQHQHPDRVVGVDLLAGLG